MRELYENRFKSHLSHLNRTSVLKWRILRLRLCRLTTKRKAIHFLFPVYLSHRIAFFVQFARQLAAAWLRLEVLILEKLRVGRVGLFQPHPAVTLARTLNPLLKEISVFAIGFAHIENGLRHDHSPVLPVRQAASRRPREHARPFCPQDSVVKIKPFIFGAGKFLPEGDHDDAPPKRLGMIADTGFMIAAYPKLMRRLIVELLFVKVAGRNLYLSTT